MYCSDEPCYVHDVNVGDRQLILDVLTTNITDSPCRRLPPLPIIDRTLSTSNLVTFFDNDRNLSFEVLRYLDALSLIKMLRVCKTTRARVYDFVSCNRTYALDFVVHVAWYLLPHQTDYLPSMVVDRVVLNGVSIMHPLPRYWTKLTPPLLDLLRYALPVCCDLVASELTFEQCLRLRYLTVGVAASCLRYNRPSLSRRLTLLGSALRVRDTLRHSGEIETLENTTVRFHRWSASKTVSDSRVVGDALDASLLLHLASDKLGKGWYNDVSMRDLDSGTIMYDSLVCTWTLLQYMNHFWVVDVSARSRSVISDSVITMSDWSTSQATDTPRLWFCDALMRLCYPATTAANDTNYDYERFFSMLKRNFENLYFLGNLCSASFGLSIVTLLTDRSLILAANTYLRAIEAPFAFDPDTWTRCRQVFTRHVDMYGVDHVFNTNVHLNIQRWVVDVATDLSASYSTLEPHVAVKRLMYLRESNHGPMVHFFRNRLYCKPLNFELTTVYVAALMALCSVTSNTDQPNFACQSNKPGLMAVDDCYSTTPCDCVRCRTDPVMNKSLVNFVKHRSTVDTQQIDIFAHQSYGHKSETGQQSGHSFDLCSPTLKVINNMLFRIELEAVFAMWCHNALPCDESLMPITNRLLVPRQSDLKQVKAKAFSAVLLLYEPSLNNGVLPPRKQLTRSLKDVEDDFDARPMASFVSKDIYFGLLRYWIRWVRTYESSDQPLAPCLLAQAPLFVVDLLCWEENWFDVHDAVAKFRNIQPIVPTPSLPPPVRLSTAEELLDGFPPLKKSKLQ